MEDWLNEINTDGGFDDMVFNQTESEEIDWRKQRLGMITGSQFGKLICKSKKDKSYTISKSITAENLIYKIAWERLLKSGNISNGLGRLDISSKSIEHGNDYEGEAIKKYTERTGRNVISECMFIKKDDWIGGTPDGFIDDDGIIEVKCPYNGGNHLKSLLTQTIYNSDYEYQIQGYLWVTDRQWCDFVTYDPDLIEGLQLNIIRVERDNEMIESISDIMEEVKNKIRSIINSEKLKN